MNEDGSAKLTMKVIRKAKILVLSVLGHHMFRTWAKRMPVRTPSHLSDCIVKYSYRLYRLYEDLRRESVSFS